MIRIYNLTIRLVLKNFNKVKNINFKYHLKNIVLSAGFLVLLNSPAYAQKIIAVLPFEVLSQNPEYKQFGIGTMDTLSVSLTGINDFVMIDRGKLNNVMKEQSFQKSGFTDLKDSVKMGKLLGAEILVTGTIQSFENKFRITASFIEVQTGKIIQASKVTGNNIFELQDQLAEQLIQLGNVKLTKEQRKEISKVTKSTENTIAYDNYIQGTTIRFQIATSGLTRNITNATESEIEEMFNKAFEYFDKAIEADKNYFLAYAAKAETQAMYYLFNSDKKNADINKLNEYLNLADKNVEVASKLSNNSRSIYRSLAFVNFVSGNDIEKSIEYSLKALEYNPKDKEAKTWLSVEYFSNGLRLYRKSDYDKAIENFEKSVEILPSFTNAYYELGNAYRAKNQLNKAIINYEKSLSIIPDNAKVIKPLLIIYQEKANEYYKNSDFLNLEKTYSSMIKYNPKDADLYNNLAIAYFMQKKYSDAESSYNKAIEIDATKASFYDNLGLLYETKGEIEKAANFYKKACEMGNQASCK